MGCQDHFFFFYQNILKHNFLSGCKVLFVVNGILWLDLISVNRLHTLSNTHTHSRRSTQSSSKACSQSHTQTQQRSEWKEPLCSLCSCSVQSRVTYVTAYCANERYSTNTSKPLFSSFRNSRTHLNREREREHYKKILLQYYVNVTISLYYHSLSYSTICYTIISLIMQWTIQETL